MVPWAVMGGKGTGVLVPVGALVRWQSRSDLAATDVGSHDDYAVGKIDDAALRGDQP